MLELWFARSVCPRGFEPRALALAFALKLRVNGEPLSTVPGSVTADLNRAWHAVSVLSKDVLGEVLALAILRADSAIFDFDSVAPSWPADIGLVIAERRALRDARKPAPTWLKSGYALLDEAFSMVRSMGASLEDCQEVWATFAKGQRLPLAFEMAFWWEATYCLTERHAYAAAEQTQGKVAAIAHALEELSGLIDPMWHHQQGRLFYYAGNYEAALAEFLREYKMRGEDLKVAAMLNREIANVLSDLACLEAARHFAEKSVEVARSQEQRSELYKSLGRLAEISIKLGDLSGAEQLLSESQSIQERIGEENRSPAQTLTYLGHVALLKGDLDNARRWYDRAAAGDEDKSSRPYILMGRFALAAAAADEVAMTQLWNAQRKEIEMCATHQTQVLPAVVCMLAAARYIPSAKDRLPAVVRLLIVNCYAIEAAYALPDLPADEQLPMTRDIITILKRWKKAMDSLPPEIRRIAGPLNGPGAIVEALRHSSLREESLLRASCYPMTLAANVSPE
ncbi:MAG TPA: tetratricopeptide repeat protein [Accumulibacter sp.]|uniref:tetratricopeptide repeat protein n=1 Tax=Accumulibacter sp. TaxID=2053492 RepID=UPI002C77DB87|nr:tetratricopeptide repeat protein [Accumulibacter sp.]HRD89501.1 tetratricopeptide repeat protein [Accumulibacter sp.]